MGWEKKRREEVGRRDRDGKRKERNGTVRKRRSEKKWEEKKIKSGKEMKDRKE